MKAKQKQKQAIIRTIDQFGMVQSVKVKLRPTRRATIVAACKKINEGRYE